MMVEEDEKEGGRSNSSILTVSKDATVCVVGWLIT